MLLYDNREWLGSLFVSHGSVVYHLVPWCTFMSLVSLLLVYLDRQRIMLEGDVDDYILDSTHPFAIVSITGCASMALVWRTTLAWSRYWEAASQAAFMFSKWADSYAQLVSFIAYGMESLEGNSSPEAVSKLDRMAQVRFSLAHNFSVLSALCTHRLIRGDLARMQRRAAKFGMSSSRCPCLSFKTMYQNWELLFTNRQGLRFQDESGAFGLPEFTVIHDEHHSTAKRVGVNSAGIFKELQERNSGDVTWDKEVAIIGALSADEIADLNARPRNGLRQTQHESEQHLDRPIYVFEWICEDINELVDLCGIPPPILSRCYQELSNGMLGFSQGIKMADIPFPFPFSQMMSVLLRIFTLVAPVGIFKFTDGIAITTLLTFGITLTYWSLIEISRELENPYADGPNQLPMLDFHERFVENLMILLQMKGRRYRKRHLEPEGPDLKPRAPVRVGTDVFEG